MAASALGDGDPTDVEVHVSPVGQDTDPGTADRPLATLEAAQRCIRQLRQSGTWPKNGVTVRIATGQYYLTNPLEFGPDDSGKRDAPVVWTVDEKARVVISGGRIVRNWKRSKGNVWTAELPEVRAGKWYFRQLFAGDRRLTRARLPVKGFFFTAGPLSRYADVAVKGNFDRLGDLRTRSPDAYCGFSFKLGDIAQWEDLSNAEVITYHSWECSWQTIRSIDISKHEVHFFTPCRYPVGIFGPHNLYRIENIQAGLTRPGEWQLDRESGILSLMAEKGEDPNAMGIVAPALTKLLIFRGDYRKKQYVENIVFRGICFEHVDYPMGIYDTARNWPAPIIKVDPTFPPIFPLGFTDAQSSPDCGQAIEMDSARNCAIERCELTNLGAYGIGIFTGCSDDRVAGCHIHSVGGGGVLVRHPGSIDGLDADDAPHDIIVDNNTIHNFGLIHPSSVGVALAHAHHDRVSHNEVSDGPYSGIHLGWTWGRGRSLTTDNLIESNHVFHVMQQMADGGGIYSLGIETGTVYRRNYIHSIFRAKAVGGGPACGLYFDEGSRDVRVEHNVITNVSKLLNFNRCAENEQKWIGNFIEEKLSPNSTTNQIISEAGPAPEYRWKGELPPSQKEEGAE
jgi:hypothetical protein